MARATWNGSVIAESEDTVVVEGNHYFPADSIRQEFFRSSEHTSACPWKGTAGYYHLDVSARDVERALEVIGQVLR